MYKLENKRFSKKCDLICRQTGLLTVNVIHRGAPLLITYTYTYVYSGSPINVCKVHNMKKNYLSK